MAATHVVLVHPEIHWNTGNAGRTCLATGATLHLIEPLGFSLDERQVKRAGLDYWVHLDLRVWSSWDAFERELPTLGEPYFFSTQATRLVWDAQNRLGHRRANLADAGAKLSARDVAQPGSAPALGAGGRQFESGRPDSGHHSS